MTRAVMIQGTASHVGKSVLTAAVGCWLQHLGLAVRPFKAQNMSLNSFVTPAGEEVARSQAAQAALLGLEPTADMNPVLLKPLDRGSQVIVRGHGVGVMSIHEYYAYKSAAWPAITGCYDRLAAGCDVVVLEGAGSPAEINLKDHDLVNMRMAAHAGARVVLVADIERGGVFAQLIGTWELLDDTERQRVAGFLINKFRGDASLLRSGIDYVERRTGRPVFGVLPFRPGLGVEEEDSLGLDAEPAETAEIDVVVVRVPGLSNFTDCAALARSPGVSVRYVADPGRLMRPDLVVIPGTRTTVRALRWLQATGFDRSLKRLAADPDGPPIIGLCGGYQILGRTVSDPEAVEWDGPPEAGLGLLPIDTVFRPRKTVCRVRGEGIAAGAIGHGCPLIGYEVHQGVSRRAPGARAWLRLQRDPVGDVVDDGAVSDDGRVTGTYVHGLFDDARFCRRLVEELRRRRGLPPPGEDEWVGRSPSREAIGRGLVAWLGSGCDLERLRRALLPE